MTTTRRDAALAIMAKTGIMKSNYYPPIVNLLWRLGIAMPLPHFISFGRVALVTGGFFGPASALLVLLFTPYEATWGNTLVPMVVGGLVFGLSMACYYAYGRRKHKLPMWHELPDH